MKFWGGDDFESKQSPLSSNSLSSLDLNEEINEVKMFVGRYIKVENNQDRDDILIIK